MGKKRLGGENGNASLNGGRLGKGQRRRWSPYAKENGFRLAVVKAVRSSVFVDWKEIKESS